MELRIYIAFILRFFVGIRVGVTEIFQTINFYLMFLFWVGDVVTRKRLSTSCAYWIVEL